jgi:hypothetical protein
MGGGVQLSADPVMLTIQKLQSKLTFRVFFLGTWDNRRRAGSDGIWGLVSCWGMDGMQKQSVFTSHWYQSSRFSATWRERQTWIVGGGECKMQSDVRIEMLTHFLKHIGQRHSLNIWNIGHKKNGQNSVGRHLKLGARTYGGDGPTMPQPTVTVGGTGKGELDGFSLGGELGGGRKWLGREWTRTMWFGRSRKCCPKKDEWMQEGIDCCLIRQGSRGRLEAGLEKGSHALVADFSTWRHPGFPFLPKSREESSSEQASIYTQMVRKFYWERGLSQSKSRKPPLNLFSQS